MMPCLSKIKALPNFCFLNAIFNNPIASTVQKLQARTIIRYMANREDLFVIYLLKLLFFKFLIFWEVVRRSQNLKKSPTCFDVDFCGLFRKPGLYLTLKLSGIFTKKKLWPCEKKSTLQLFVIETMIPKKRRCNRID